MADFQIRPLNLSWLGELPDVAAKAKERARDEQLNQILSGGLPRGPGGTIDWAAAADQAARAGNMGAVQAFSQLQNAAAARASADAARAETKRHNQAVENQPRIFGSAEGGYYTIDRNGQPQPLAAQPQPQQPQPQQDVFPDPAAGNVLPQEPAATPQLVPGATVDRMPPAAIAQATGAPAVAPRAPAPALPPGVRQVIPPKAKDVEFTPEARDLAARRLINGDPSAMTGLGRGAQGDRAIKAVQNRAAEMLITEQNMTPEQAAAHIGEAKQKFSAAGIGKNAWARTAANREANLDIILKATEAAFPAALEASKALPRTTWVPLNRIIQKGQVMSSDPRLLKFGMANLQLAEHWARAMNPTGVMRESDRDKALEYLGTATSHATYEKAVSQLRTQIEREAAAVRAGHTTSSVPGSTRTIPKGAINDLLSNPSTAALFDKEFGPGQAERILSGAR